MSALSRLFCGLALVVYVLLTLVPAARAQIGGAAGAGSVASIVDCIRSGEQLAAPAEASPRIASACFGTAWNVESYTASGASVPAGDAPPRDPAVIVFGDAKPDAAGQEPGKVTLATLGDVGAVYGLAYAGGTNPAAPNTRNGLQPTSSPRATRLFAAAFTKRLTRFGPLGPGAIYAIDLASGAVGGFVVVPGVVPGPATVQTHAAGVAYAPGDGSAASYPSARYSAGLGGVHTTRADTMIQRYASITGLGGIALDGQERMLYAVNLNTRRVVRFDTWAPNPQATLTILPDLVAALRPCVSRGGMANYRPFAVRVDAGGLLLGGICSGFAPNPAGSSTALRIDRYDLASGQWSQLLGSALDNYAAQRGSVPARSDYRLAWQRWSDTLPAEDPYLRPAPQAVLADIEPGHAGDLYLGLRDRLGDMGGVPRLAAPARGYGDLLIARRGAGGTLAEPTRGGDPTGDDGLPGGAAGVHHNEALWGGLALVPGRHDGTPGEEIAVSAMAPLRTNSAGILWYDRGMGSPSAREEIYSDSRSTAFAKVSGLGDLELLCAWSAVGDRVWLDADHDGQQEPGEPGVDGVRVELFASGDTSFQTPLAVVQTADIDGDGNGGEYRFYVAPFRSYRVRLAADQFDAGGTLAAYFVAPQRRGAAATDSDADQISRAADVAALDVRQVQRDIDIGLVPVALANGLVGDRVWRDDDAEGDQDAGEPGIAGAGSILERCGDPLPRAACRNWLSIVAQTTDASGRYVFGRLVPGYYRVRFAPSAGFVAAPRDAVADTADSDADATVEWLTEAVRIVSDSNDPTLDLGLVPAAGNVTIARVAPTDAVFGELVSATISYRVDPSGAAATNVLISDALPAGLTFVRASVPPASVNGGQLSWQIGALAAGARGEITVLARADGLGAQRAIATIAAIVPGDLPDDNRAETTTTVRRPQLAVTKTAPTVAAPGEIIDYTIIVRNAAGSSVPASVLAPAAGVMLTDSLPPGTSLIGAQPAPTTVSGNTLTWQLGTLAAGETRSFAVQVRVEVIEPIPPVVRNTVRINTVPGDDPAGNESSAETRIRFPDVTVALSAAPDPVGEGGRLVYRVRYGNQGEVPAAGSLLTFELPAGVTFEQAGPLPPALVAGRQVTWQLGELAPGQNGTLEIVVRVSTSATSLRASATIGTTTPGDPLANNRAEATPRLVRAPAAPSASADMRLAIHSTLDPLSDDADPRNAVYLTSGMTFAWPLGEVLDASPVARVVPDALAPELEMLYTQEARVSGWSLIDTTIDGRPRSATAADDMNQRGCRARERGVAGEGCDYRYVASGPANAPEPPDEAAMAGQAHLFYAVGLPLQMRPDVYVYRLQGLGSAPLRIQVLVDVIVRNRDTGEEVRRVSQRITATFTVRLVAQRSAR